MKQITIIDCQVVDIAKGPEMFFDQIDYMDMSNSFIQPKARLIYRKVDCIDGSFWLIPTNIPNSADHVHFAPCLKDQASSQGYGGSVLTFMLEDGLTIDVKGPWHGNADSMLKDTGVDIRDRHYTQVVIGLERITWPESTSVCGGVRKIIYHDFKPVLGRFDRYKDIAKLMANDWEQTVYVIQASSGGGMAFEEKYAKK